MTTVRHVARAAGSTGSSTPAYRVDIRAGVHDLMADEPAAVGGGDAGPSPFGLVLAGLVACTATTLRMYAEHKGWELTTIDVDVRYDLTDGSAAITRTITFPPELDAERRARLADVAERTPVTLALRGGTPITTSVRPGREPPELRGGTDS